MRLLMLMASTCKDQVSFFENALSKGDVLAIDVSAYMATVVLARLKERLEQKVTQLSRQQSKPTNRHKAKVPRPKEAVLSLSAGQLLALVVYMEHTSQVPGMQDLYQMLSTSINQALEIH